MDHGVCLSCLTLFGACFGINSNVTWFSSMLLSFGIAIQTTFFNINTDEKSTVPSVEWNKGEKVLHCLVLFAVSLITVSFLWGRAPRAKSQWRGTREMNKTALYDLPEYSLSQLNSYNGSTEGGKIYVALNGKIFDVSDDRKQYNPGGSYKMLAGRDASRAFATLSFGGDSFRSDYDELSDIDDIQRSNLSEWENIFSQKYSIVGRMVHVHCPKSLQELSMKTISKSLLLCQPNANGKSDCIHSLPLPHRLKNTLRNYFHEHME